MMTKQHTRVQFRVFRAKSMLMNVRAYCFKLHLINMHHDRFKKSRSVASSLLFFFAVCARTVRALAELVSLFD